MKKKIIAFCFVVLLTAVSIFAVSEVKPKTTKHTINSKTSAVIYMTEIYSGEAWSEFYLVYEEDNNTYDEAEAEKIIYEFVSNYKVEKKFSRVEIEDLKDAAKGKKTTKIEKRIIFRQVRK